MRLVIILTLLLFTSPAWASPFLVCNEDSSHEFYLIILDNQSEIRVDSPLHFDLVGIAVGSHNIEVRAGNKWGVSESIPFSFTKTLPVPVTGLGLSSE